MRLDTRYSITNIRRIIPKVAIVMYEKLVPRLKSFATEPVIVEPKVNVMLVNAKTIARLNKTCNVFLCI